MSEYYKLLFPKSLIHELLPPSLNFKNSIFLFKPLKMLCAL